MNYTIHDINGAPRTVNITVELIDPKKAAEYLSHNIENNRKKNDDRVAAYSRDMAALDWEFTGQTIVFDSEGRLIDGQHRLEAIIKSDEIIEIIVVRGINPDAVAFIDKGRGRSFNDTMKITENDTILRLSSTQATIRSVVRNETSVRILSESELEWLYTKFANECHVVSRLIPHNLGKPFVADFRGACLAALIAGVSETDLAEYIKVMRTRMPTMRYNDDAALKWEDTIHRTIGRTLEGSQMYLGTENSIYHFISGRKYRKYRELKHWFEIKDKVIEAIQSR